MPSVNLRLKRAYVLAGRKDVEIAQRSMDAGLMAAFDGAELVGPGLRENLLHELKSKVILRAGRDPIEIIGGTGSGSTRSHRLPMQRASPCSTGAVRA